MNETTQRQMRIFGGLTVLVTFIVFLPSLANGFVWDDNLLILRNANVQSKPLAEVWFLRLWDASGVSDSMLNPLYADVYRPWITFCFAALFRLFGESPMPYHAVSVAVHLGTTWMVFRWLSAATPNATPLCVAIATMFFSIHPSKVESVAWISGSTDVWMAFFVLLVLRARQNSQGAARYATLALGFMFALFSKETAVVFIAWMLAEDYLGLSLRSNLRDYLSLAGGATVAFAFRFAALSGFGASAADRLPSELSDAWPVASTYGHYLRQVVDVLGPAVQPSYRHYEPGYVPVFDSWSIVVGTVFVLFVVAFGVRNLKRPPRAPLFFLGLLMFLLGLLPVSNLIHLDTESLTADRFLYLPILGLSLSLLAILGALMSAAPKPRQLLAAGVGALMVLTFGSVSVAHIGTFSNELTLRENSLRHDPGNLYAMFLLAGLKKGAEARAIHLRGQQRAIAEGRPELALKFALGALRLLATETADLDQRTLTQLLEAYQQLEREGAFHLRHTSMQLDAGLSKSLHERTLRNVSDYLQPYAAVAARTGRFETAQRLIEKAISLAPNNGQLRADLAILLAKKGEWKGAQEAITSAEKRLPGDQRIAEARRLFDRAHALHQAIPSLQANAQALAKVYEPLAVSDLRSARAAYIGLWEEAGPQPDLLNAALQVELADRLPDRARELLQRARMERPELEEAWSKLEHEVIGADLPDPRRVW